jgi:membrane protease YdiL (CAAX protease family)
MNTYLKYQPPVMQFFAFLAFAGGFFLVSFVVISYFFGDIGAALVSKDLVYSPELIARFKWAQVIYATIAFLVPALLLGYFSAPDMLPYIGLQKSIAPVLILSAIVLIVAIQPFVGWLGELNSHIKFGSAQKIIEEMEEASTKSMNFFLQMKSLGDLIINLLIMALLPAFAEELFFRGSMQRVLLRLSGKPWVAILVSSLVFALLHNTFTKIIPIFTLGIMLGIIYHFTRNLWYTVIIHFINNAFAVLSVYYANKSEFLKKMSDDSLSVPVYGALVSLIIGVGIIYFMKRKSDEVFPAVLTSEDNDYIA